MAAPITTFFDITPIGRILNRFSRDLDEVDNPLPYWGLWLALCIFQVASSFIVCAVVNPFVLIVYVPVGYGCWFAAKVYRASARELKRLDGVSRSPFLNLMSETISGIETVRSYKMVDAFASRCEELLNKNIRVFFLAQVSSRWFDMRSDWLVSVIIGAVAILAVAAKSTVGASVAGLGLTYAAQLSSNFQRMTTLATKVESSMTCFERIAHYGSLDEEGFKRTPSNKDALSPAWPKTGNVVFENVSMRYREDLPLVLKGVSFSVTSGEKVGICGRTGSGKSSLMSVLFRVVEIPTAGRVLIDGVDISTITVHQLRTKLTIIPQDPMLFSGSLRMNLDPFAEKSDAELWEVLRKVHLADTVSSWGKGLDYEVAEKGENLSVGQRQLLCIARALIRDSKVIVMDEATANVDQESDKLIQQTMKESFGDGNNTVLCIAHRIETIMDSDKILVLDAGEVAEFDSPSALLQIKAGIFKSLVGSGKITLS
ncbi:ABC transporter C family member 8 [Phytophthora cactorum]|nr:ABC transporter C family member 8 [Phytophthora cactorum]